MPGGIMIPSRTMSPANIGRNGGIAYASSSSSALSLGQNLLDGHHHQLPAMLQQHQGQPLVDQHHLPQHHHQQQAATSESDARGPRGGSNADELEMSKSGGSDNLEGGGGSDEEQDPNQRPRKKRYHRHTQHQIQELEAFFKECPHPDDRQRKELGRELGLEPLQVKFWFQNKRTQMKKIKGGIKSEFGGLACGKSRTHRRLSLPSVVCASEFTPLPLLRGCLGLLRSRFCSSAPPTPPWSSSTVEFVEQVVLFGTQSSSSFRNVLFPSKWSIMPLIDVCDMF